MNLLLQLCSEAHLCARDVRRYEATIVLFFCRSPRWCKDNTGAQQMHRFLQPQPTASGAGICLQISETESDSCRGSDPLFRNAESGTARRSSPGAVQVSSSFAAPQTRARAMSDFTVVNCLFICVSMSGIRGGNQTQLLTTPESFQCIPCLHRHGSVRKVSPPLTRSR